MKKEFLFLIIFLLFNISVQAQITITMEDAYSFNRIKNALVLVENKTNKTVYKADTAGIIHLNNYTDKVNITFYSEGYETIQTHFNANEPIRINVILEPKTGYKTPKTDQNILFKGVIYDELTGKPLKNTTVSFNEFKKTLQTDDKGQFVLKKSEIPYYLSFKEGDAISYTIANVAYKIATKTVKFTTATTYIGIALEAINKQQITQALMHNELQDIITSSLQESTARSANYTCDNLPSTIRVGTNCNCNNCTTVSVMGIEVYTRKGLNDEWIASWNTESLKAGSLPYKSYGAYHVAHPIATNFDISSTTCRQVWDSDYASSCISACAVTQGKYMVTSTNNIAFTEYSAENNGLNAPAGTSCGDGYAGNSTSSPCIADALCAGHDRYGHGRGMCQWGTQRWALQGKTYQWIADHYYNPVNIYRCDDGSNTVALDCSNAVTLSCGVSYHGASSTAASNVGQYACNTWTETGPERVHTWTATSTGTFTVTVSNYTGDLDVYILGSCDPSDCLGTVSSSAATYANAVYGHTYYIVVDADDGSGSAYDIVVDCSALSVADVSLTDVITIAPNPSEGVFVISTNQQNSLKTVNLYNALGQFIQKVTTDTIDLSSFASGFYYLEITTINNTKKTFKLIKK